MAEFLKDITLFFGILATLAGGLWGLNSRLLQHHDLAVDPEAVVVFLGDSHVGTAADPALVPGSENLSGSAEPLSITYLKLRRVIEDYPRIKAVVLGFGPHNLSQIHDLSLIEPPNANRIFSTHYGLFRESDLELVPYSKRIYRVSQIRKLATPNFHLLGDWVAERNRDGGRRNHYPVGFSSSSTTLLDPDILTEVLDRHFPAHSRGEPSSVQAGAFNRIIDLARDSEVALLLLSTPTHPEYRDGIPTELVQAHRTLWEAAVAQPGVTELPLADLALPDSLYRDFDHVNQRGAVVVSRAIESWLAGGGR